MEGHRVPENHYRSTTISQKREKADPAGSALNALFVYGAEEGT